MGSLRWEVLFLVALSPSSIVLAEPGRVSSGDVRLAPRHVRDATIAPVAPADDHEDEPRYPDLQVLFIMNWRHAGAEAELRRMEEIGGAFEKLRDQGWKVGIAESDNLRIVSSDQVSELVERLQFQSYPAVVAVHDGDVIRSFRSGCTTPLDEYTFHWMRTGVSRRPANAPTMTAQVEWSGSYPLRGAHWSVDGSYAPTQEHLLRHLRGANHRHLIPGDWPLESWSYEELRSLHDDLHEMNRPRALMQSSFADGSRSSPRRSTSRSSPQRYVPAMLVP